MAKSFLVSALAGSFVMASLGAALAQEAAAPQAPQQAAPAPAGSGCNGLGCLFSGGSAPSQSAAAAPASGAPPSATPAPAQTIAADPDLEAPRDAKPRARPKPAVHPVTIAAAPAEVDRLKGLVSAMPKGRVKIVAEAAGTDRAATDFSVATVLDGPANGEKAKLFTEQMHILAGGAIQSVADLKDKVVSFGPDKSASQIAGRKAFEALNIPVKETPLDLDNALDGLATGDVAAVVVLAPQPVHRFEALKGAGLHLLAWPQDGALPAGAVATSIDGSRYPGLAKPDEAIRAVGVDAVLLISAKGARQPASRSFLNALSQHSAALSKRGFDLIKADLEGRNGRRFASDESR